jgi:hypothetical protein
VVLKSNAGQDDTTVSDPSYDMNLDLNENCSGDSDMEDVLPEQSLEELNDTFKKLREAALKNDVLKKKKKPKKTPLSKITPYPCEHCGKTLIGRGNLVSHIKRIHYKLRNHKCIVCKSGFYTSSSLESHMLAVHTRRCETCQEYVIESVPWPEGTDMKTRRSVTCVCGAVVDIYCHFGRKRSNEEEEENVQKRRYKDNTKYACQFCGKIFSRKAHCVRHTKLHTKVNDIHCKYCPETFRYEVSLKKHVQTAHKLLQDFACTVCKKTYATSIELEQHAREKHGHDSGEGTDKRPVKVITKEDTSVQNVITVRNDSRSNLQSFKEACDKEAAGNQQSGMTLASLPGTSHRVGDSTVSLTAVSDGSLDRAAYELVQQALQGDQMFSGGNTIIIRAHQD